MASREGDIPDVGNRVACRTGSFLVILIVFIIEEDELLPLKIQDPSLVSVGGSLVRCAGENSGVLLVGDIVDGQGVLVVAVANVTAYIFLIRAFVYKALSVVDITVLGSTARRCWVGDVSKVDEDQASTASGRTRRGTNCNGIVLRLVDDNVVGTACRQVGEEASQVRLGAENLGFGGIKIQQLPEVEDLNTVVHGFTTDDKVVLVATDFPPD